MLPQGLPALNLEFIKENGNVFKWPEKVRKTLETKELLDYQNKKIATASQMSDYVSNMMKDYITSDNIWKTVVKTTPVSIFCKKLWHFSKKNYFTSISKYMYLETE